MWWAPSNFSKVWVEQKSVRRAYKSLTWAGTSVFSCSGYRCSWFLALWTQIGTYPTCFHGSQGFGLELHSQLLWATQLADGRSDCGTSHPSQWCEPMPHHLYISILLVLFLWRTLNDTLGFYPLDTSSTTTALPFPIICMQQTKMSLDIAKCPLVGAGGTSPCWEPLV